MKPLKGVSGFPALGEVIRDQLVSLTSSRLSPSLRLWVPTFREPGGWGHLSAPHRKGPR